ncbi:hypothetical protein DY000_02041254 [Brassica cretica]|uniref:Uncharacterized protein n=1 Tax=Brassica cretica TaxID=69181 RepID=A0ABQ7BR63_BRACR|nr:hypothetical protein DY000_02041254 [Brassica cretica]
MLGTTSPWVGQSLVVFNVVFLVVGLSLIVTARLGFQDLVFADLTFTQKLLDFGEVKRSYISFFDIEKHETVNSRWDLKLGQEQMRFDIGKEKEVKIVKKCLG